MLQNAYFLAKIGADTAENEQHFAEILPKTGNYPTGPPKELPGGGLLAEVEAIKAALDLDPTLSLPAIARSCCRPPDHHICPAWALDRTDRHATFHLA